MLTRFFCYSGDIVKIEGKKQRGIFIERPNRFEALVEVDGSIERVHVPNTGRMKELLHTGCEVVLLEANNPNRKTKYTMMFVYKGKNLICVNSAFANRVFEDAFKRDMFPWLNGNLRREVKYNNSRFDFLIEGDVNTFVEVKCGTYEEDDILMFPDAPTERGRRHIDELILAKNEGFNTAIVIIAFMDYVKSFTPNYKIDREFGEKLYFAYQNSVNVKVYNCNVTIDNVDIKEEIKINF